MNRAVIVWLKWRIHFDTTISDTGTKNQNNSTGILWTKFNFQGSKLIFFFATFVKSFCVLCDKKLTQSTRKDYTKNTSFMTLNSISRIFSNFDSVVLSISINIPEYEKNITANLNCVAAE